MLLQALALAACASCAAAQSDSLSGSASGSSPSKQTVSLSFSAPPISASIQNPGVLPTSTPNLTVTVGATTRPPRIVAATALTTFSAQPLPSFASQRVVVEKPDYTSRYPYKSFWPGFEPGGQEAVQPVVENPLTGIDFELSTSDPNDITWFDLRDPSWFIESTNETLANPAATFIEPGYNLSLFSTLASRALAKNITTQLYALFNATNASDSDASCQTCIKSLKLAKVLAQQAPWEAVQVMIDLCNVYHYSTYENQTCAQIFSLSEYDYGLDAQWQCASAFAHYQCPSPPTSFYYPRPQDILATPKPAKATAPQVKEGTKRLKVVHITDIHLDGRYAIGGEGNCTDYLCCRTYSTNTKLHTSYENASIPAPAFGWFDCDTPMGLLTSALQAIPDVAGLGADGPDFTVFTGDIVSHENDNQLSIPYDFWSESVVYTMLHQYLTGENRTKPVYPSVGNHDGRFGNGFNIPNQYRPAYLQSLYNENYDQLVGLWQQFGWLPNDVAQAARQNYSQYSVMTSFGLRLIHFNTNWLYSGNVWLTVNTSNADASGSLLWLANELASAERAGERVWILGHVPPGWDGYSSQPNPSDLFGAIVERYSPHVIAEILLGHNHEDETYTHYRYNGTDISAEGALVQTWLGGSITPLHNQNPRFRLYEIDSETFNIVDAHTWYTDISANINNTERQGIEWKYEYNTRYSYGQDIDWPSYAPLNATWWYHVAQLFNSTTRPDLVELFQLHQSGYSSQTPNCTAAVCQRAKACYMCSATWGRARLGDAPDFETDLRAEAQNCNPNYAATVGGFDGS